MATNVSIIICWLGQSQENDISHLCRGQNLKGWSIFYFKFFKEELTENYI